MASADDLVFVEADSSYQESEEEKEWIRGNALWCEGEGSKSYGS